MRSRTRAEEPQRNDADRRREERPVRVPKIQYRFLKELEETGVNGGNRVAALAMADKIKRYPLEAAHVMASWERFTKKAIDEYKAGRGDNAARERQHGAYAVLFAALKDGRVAQSIGDLKQHIEVFGANHPPRTDGAPRQTSRPQQQSLPELQRAPIERQIENSLAAVRGLPSPLRTAVETSARDLLSSGHSPTTAREAMPVAVRDLEADRSEANTVRVLALATVSATPAHTSLLNEAQMLPASARVEFDVEAQARADQYGRDQADVAGIRKAALEAAVRDVVSPSAEAHREALVLASARDRVERVADPKRDDWRQVANELVQQLG